jgi:hypothetical protein
LVLKKPLYYPGHTKEADRYLCQPKQEGFSCPQNKPASKDLSSAIKKLKTSIKNPTLKLDHSLLSAITFVNNR